PVAPALKGTSQRVLPRPTKRAIAMPNAEELASRHRTACLLQLHILVMPVEGQMIRQEHPDQISRWFTSKRCLNRTGSKSWARQLPRTRNVPGSTRLNEPLPRVAVVAAPVADGLWSVRRVPVQAIERAVPGLSRQAGFQNPCDGMRNARLKREDAFSH